MGASLTAAGAGDAAAAQADLLAQLPIDPEHPFDAACAGSAGSNVPGARELPAGRLAPLTRSGTVVIVNDAMLVLPAAGLDAGVGVICGTGSIAVGAWAGRTGRAGGFGYLPGDEGSGYWITRVAVRTLLDRRDRGSRTAPATVASSSLSRPSRDSVGSTSMSRVPGWRSSVGEPARAAGLAGSRRAAADTLASSPGDHGVSVNDLPIETVAASTDRRRFRSAHGAGQPKHWPSPR